MRKLNTTWNLFCSKMEPFPEYQTYVHALRVHGMSKWEKLRVVLMREPDRVRNLLVEYERAQQEWLGAGRYEPDLAQTVREVYLKILDVL